MLPLSRRAELQDAKLAHFVAQRLHTVRVRNRAANKSVSFSVASTPANSLAALFTGTCCTAFAA